MARLNKSTGLFGMGSGKRKGAKSKIGDALDQLKKRSKRRKLVKSNTKSRAEDVKDVYKYSKRDSIKAYKSQGMSRSEAKEQTMKDSKAKVKDNRSKARAVKTSDKAASSAAKKVEDDKRRAEAKSKGQKLAYDTGSKGLYEGTPEEQRAKSPGGGAPTVKKNSPADIKSRNSSARRAATVGTKGGMESYTHTNADGSTVVKRFRLSGERGKKLRVKNGIPEAQEGAKVKAVKKAQEGGKVKSKSFGVLKSDTNKAGPNMEPGKEPYTKNGVTYTWDRKNSVWRGDVKGNEGVGKKSRAVKKAKKGASVGGPYEVAMAKWEKAMDAWKITKKEAINKGQLIPAPPTKPVKPPKASAPDISSKSDNTKTPNVRVNKKIVSSFTSKMEKWEKDMAAWKKADRNGEFDGKLIPAKPTKPVK